MTVAQKIRASTQLNILPSPFFPFQDDCVKHHFQDFIVRGQRLAVVGEGQADGTFAGEKARTSIRGITADRHPSAFAKYKGL